MIFRGICELCGSGSVFSNDKYVIVAGVCQKPTCGYPIRLYTENEDDGRQTEGNYPDPEEGLSVRCQETL
jgi:hypothetical protein